MIVIKDVELVALEWLKNQDTKGKSASEMYEIYKDAVKDIKTQKSAPKAQTFENKII